MYNYFACGSSCEVLWLVCLCVCVSVQQDISGTTRTVFTKFFAHVAYGCGLVFLQHVDDRPHHLSPGRGFLPHWKCIVQHSIWDPSMSVLGPTNMSVTWGWRSPKGKGQFGGNVPNKPNTSNNCDLSYKGTILYLLTYRKVVQNSISYY